jgi:uncharacterized surface protein with fasciclin (FAS1) repeats
VSDSAYLANDSSFRQTIFVPEDEAYASAAEVLKSIRYNFISSPLDPEQLGQTRLLPTKYVLSSLGDRPQYIKVSHVNGTIRLNNLVPLVPKPTLAGNTTIYTLKGELLPPGPLRPTATQALSLFRSFHHLVSVGLDHRVLFEERGVTVFMPDDEAWRELGVTERYLLGETGVLERVLLRCVVREVEYSEGFTSDGKEYNSLEGGTVSIAFDGEEVTFDGIRGKMLEPDILAQNGVGHSLSFVPFPEDVTVGAEHLANLTGTQTWFSLLRQHNLSEYLSPSNPSTLLVPTDSALSAFPLTTMSRSTILTLLKLHIIPRPSAEPVNLLTPNTHTTTLSNHTLSIHEIYRDTYTITSPNGPPVRVLDHALLLPSKSQLLLLDSVLLPPAVNSHPVLTIVAAGIFLLALGVSVVVGGRWLWWRVKGRETKPLFYRDEEESEPLLNGNVPEEEA